MAELSVGAPIATMEEQDEDWNDFENSAPPAADSGGFACNGSAGGPTTSSAVSGPRCNGETISPDGSMNGSWASHGSSTPTNSCGFGEDGHLSSSLEDLVGTFDKRLSECFGDYDAAKMARLGPPPASSTKDAGGECDSTVVAGNLEGVNIDLVANCPTWWTLTGNFGNVLPIDWSKCHIRELHTQALRLSRSASPAFAPPTACNNASTLTRGSSASAPNDLDLSDDEELSEAFDVHSIVTSAIPPCGDREQSADEVIRELDAMMSEEDGGMNAGGVNSVMTGSVSMSAVMTGMADEGYATTQSSMISSSDSDNMHFRAGGAETAGSDSAATLLQRCCRGEAGGPTSLAGNLAGLTTLELNEVVDELQTRIREGSTELVKALAERDEAEYQNELRNRFIATAHLVMKKGSGKDRASGSAQKAKGGGRGMGPAPVVIPYTPAEPGTDGDISSSPALSNEMLVVQIRLLEAVHDESASLPAQLTEYILKAVCPPKI